MAVGEERLYEFPVKSTPTPADIVYLGDASNAFNEVQSTIEELISAYPNLLGTAELVMGNSTYAYKDGAGIWTAGSINSFGIAVLASITSGSNKVLATDGSGVPDLVDTLPTDVQDNITLLGTQAEALDMGSHLINNVTDPVSNQDAATKAYVDAIASGLTVKSPCRVATTANLNATYNNGASGVGATLTNAGAQVALSIDGVALSLNNRVLVKDQSSTPDNGIYYVSDVGSGASNWVLTRTTDFDTPAEIQPGAYVLVLEGILNTATSYVETATVTTIGTDPIVWNQFSSDVNTLITNIQNQAYNYVLDTGTKNTYVATLSPAVTSYVAGLLVSLKIANSNDAASTLNVNGLGAKSIKLLGGSDLFPGNLQAGYIGYFIYDGTNFQLLSPINPLPAQQNIIIGGNFTINPWQRGVSVSLGTTGQTYLADRFNWLVNSDAVVTYQNTLDSPTIAQAGVYSTNCLHIDVTTADATIGAGQYAGVQYIVEGTDISTMGFGQAGTRYITLSFWHKHTKTGTYCVGFSNASSNRSYVAEYTQFVTNTWEYVYIVIPVDTSGTWAVNNTAGLAIYFDVAVGSTFQAPGGAGSWQAGNYLGTSNQVNGLDNTANDFKIALVKLESGNIATPYPIENTATILERCQRYYEKSYNGDAYPGTVNYLGSSGGKAAATSAQLSELSGIFKSSKRTVPTIVIYNPNSGASASMRDETAATNRVVNSVDVIGTSSWNQLTTATNCTAGARMFAQWTANAEL